MSTHHADALQPAAGDTSLSLNRLLFRKLLPLLITAYVISFLDRTNIAFAKHSMGVDLGISSAAYGLGAGLFFLTYAAFEVPSNLIMHKCGAKFWITRIMITWGLLSAGMAFVQGETSFYVMRLLLGAAGAAHAQTSVTLYGVIDTSIAYVHGNNGEAINSWQML